jgi:DnaJ like chaperone protein
MSFWKAGIGGMIGFTIGGPIGGILGAIIGSKLSDQKQPRPTNNQQHQVAFFTALFACFAKIAKADGKVTREEVDMVDQFIKDRFKFPQDQRGFAIDIFNHAKDDQNSFGDYANQLASILSSNPSALIMFYELLFELSMADGYLDPAEEQLLFEAISIFNIDPNLFEINKKKFGGNITDAYAVLGVHEGMPFKEIKTAYQRKRKEFHPDTLLSKGLPEELLDKAKDKFIEIQSAFEEIENQKNKLN